MYVCTYVRTYIHVHMASLTFAKSSRIIVICDDILLLRNHQLKWYGLTRLRKYSPWDEIRLERNLLYTNLYFSAVGKPLPEVNLHWVALTQPVCFPTNF